MKTGYIYIVALNGRFGRVLRLGTSLGDPALRLRRLMRVKGRRRAPKLIGYEFVEDMIGARGQVRRSEKSSWTKYLHRGLIFLRLRRAGLDTDRVPPEVRRHAV